jgi:hypothetical protein
LTISSPLTPPLLTRREFPDSGPCKDIKLFTSDTLERKSTKRIHQITAVAVAAIATRAVAGAEGGGRREGEGMLHDAISLLCRWHTVSNNHHEYLFQNALKVQLFDRK